MDMTTKFVHVYGHLFLMMLKSPASLSIYINNYGLQSLCILELNAYRQWRNQGEAFVPAANSQLFFFLFFPFCHPLIFQNKNMLKEWLHFSMLMLQEAQLLCSMLILQEAQLLFSMVNTNGDAQEDLAAYCSMG